MPSITATSKNRLARLTSAGAGAIATLALSGPDAWRIVSEIFQPVGKNFNDSSEPGQFRLGDIGDPKAGRDRVVLAVKCKEPVPSVEIHCHGGPQVVALLEETFRVRGVQICTWEEFHAPTTGSRLQTAAVKALSQAVTTRTASIVLDQYNGAFEKTICEILDFLQESNNEKAARKLQELARWTSLGRHLTAPWRITVAGAVNVGKSSLINRLAGYERCIVSATPGTTRDVVATRIAVDGWPVEMRDTAGRRESTEALEKAGIDLAEAATIDADLVLWLVDAAADPVWPRRSVANMLLVVNKIDLPAKWELGLVNEAAQISAKTGEGIDDLLDLISRRLVPETPAPGAAVPFDNAICSSIEEALTSCRRGDSEKTLRILRELV